MKCQVAKRFLSLLLVTFTIFTLSTQTFAKRSDPKECEVCKKTLEDLKGRASNVKNNESIEEALKTYCKGRGKESKEKKLCYYLEPVQREVSKPLAMGVPVDRVCKRIAKRTPEVCELRFPEQIDLEKIDLNKLRVRQLKKLLSERGLTCDGCIEKGDYVRKLKEHVKTEL